MVKRLVFFLALGIAVFMLMFGLAGQVQAYNEQSPLLIPYRQFTPTVTITPTVFVTVTVIVTATPTETIVPTETPTPTTTPTETPTTIPTPTNTPIPLPTNAPPILASIEAEFRTIWDTIGTLQLAYYFVHGTPWQGLITHSVIPADGAVIPADRLLLHPTDSQTNWLDFYAAFPLATPYALRIDTYEGEGGRGFVAHLFVRVGADVWHRAIDYGSGTFEEQWSIVDLLLP